jgi:hypothetical protein
MVRIMVHTREGKRRASDGGGRRRETFDFFSRSGKMPVFGCGR